MGTRFTPPLCWSTYGRRADAQRQRELTEHTTGCAAGDFRVQPHLDAQGYLVHVAGLLLGRAPLVRLPFFERLYRLVAVLGLRYTTAWDSKCVVQVVIPSQPPLVSGSCAVQAVGRAARLCQWSDCATLRGCQFVCGPWQQQPGCPSPDMPPGCHVNGTTMSRLHFPNAVRSC